ncbi:MAG: prepilin peptidase [Gammaproteobacteria bacterium]|nr:prepilin peptidase [Gammaproteobacteria bacterium]
MAPLNLTAMLAWSAAISVSDLRTRRIPNLLSLGAVMTAVLVLVAQGESATGAAAGSALLAAGLALAFTLPAYLGGGVGAGDVKLALALALLSDVSTLVASFVIGSLLAGLWAVLWLAAKGSTSNPSALSIQLHSMAWVNRLTAPVATKRPVPFGAALAMGFVVSLLARDILPGI